MYFKRKLSRLAIGVSLALAATVASASPINLGGVIFDPSSPFNFLATSNLFERLVKNIGDTAQGFGLITRLDESDALTFCPTCQLTFTFDGFKLIDPDPTHLLFTGGNLNFFVQDKADPGFTTFDATNAASAGDGVLFLSLKGHTDTRTGYSGPGTWFGNVDAGTLGSGTERGKAGGLLDVVGGLAAGNFDTDTVEDSAGKKTDINFTSTFFQNTDKRPGSPALAGTADFQGEAVPEPATVLLFGVGLLALGLHAKRRSKAL